MRVDYYIDGYRTNKKTFINAINENGTTFELSKVMNGEQIFLNGVSYWIEVIEDEDFRKYYINNILTIEDEFFDEVNERLSKEDLEKVLNGIEVEKIINGEKVVYKTKSCNEEVYISTIPPTLAELEKMHLIYEKTCVRARAIMEWENAHSDEKVYISPHNIEEIEFGKNSVEVKTGESWAYGGYEQHSYTIPFSKFVNDDWHDDFIESVKVAREKKELAKKEKEESVRREKEEKERAEYERLHAIYGKGDL